jgi:hypothetical protein
MNRIHLMNVVISLIISIVFSIAGYYLGRESGIETERLRAIDSNAGRYIVDRSTGECIGFIYGHFEKH